MQRRLPALKHIVQKCWAKAIVLSLSSKKFIDLHPKHTVQCAADGDDLLRHSAICTGKACWKTGKVGELLMEVWQNWRFSQFFCSMNRLLLDFKLSLNFGFANWEYAQTAYDVTRMPFHWLCWYAIFHHLFPTLTDVIGCSHILTLAIAIGLTAGDYDIQPNCFLVCSSMDCCQGQQPSNASYYTKTLNLSPILVRERHTLWTSERRVANNLIYASRCMKNSQIDLFERHKSPLSKRKKSPPQHLKKQHKDLFSLSLSLSLSLTHTHTHSSIMAMLQRKCKEHLLIPFFETPHKQHSKKYVG